MKIRQGSRKDAIKFAIQANSSHGLPRTNKDNRRSVELALTAFPELSDRAFATTCKVSNPFVLNLRPQLVTVTSCAERIGRDGTKRKRSNRDSATSGQEELNNHSSESATPACHTPTSQPKPDVDDAGGPVKPAKTNPARTEQTRAPARPDSGNEDFPIDEAWGKIENFLITEMETWPASLRKILGEKLQETGKIIAEAG